MTAFSFGKVIFSGEHSAVYDQPAVAATVDLRTEAVLETRTKSTQPNSPFLRTLFAIFQEKYHRDAAGLTLRFTGNLPIGSGLGSSAAAAYAAFQALAEYFRMTLLADDYIALIQESERFVHGHPSGLDTATIVKKGVVQFQRHGEKLSSQNLLPQVIQQHSFFLIQSGVPAESTKTMIKVVQNSHQSVKGQRAVQAIGMITTQLIQDLQSQQFFPEWMTENERYLEELGVVSAKAKQMIRDVEQQSGFAKITGAGGVSDGSGMILSTHSDKEKFEQFLQEKEWSYFSGYLGVT
jgi:mevalonate kinase